MIVTARPCSIFSNGLEMIGEEIEDFPWSDEMAYQAATPHS